MPGCNHAALMGERDGEKTDPPCGRATMVLVDWILQGFWFRVSLESNIYLLLKPSFPWSKLPLPRPCPLERVLIQIETSGATHQQIETSTWHASLAGLLHIFLMAKQIGFYVSTSCSDFWGSTIWRIFAFSLCPMEYMEQDLQSTLWLLCALGAPKETKLI